MEFINEINKNISYCGGKTDNSTEVIQVYGGGTKKRNIVISNNLVTNFKMKVVEWESLKKYVLGSKKKSSNKKTNKLILNSFNYILNLPENLNDTKSILLFIKEFYKLSDRENIQIIEKSLELRQSYNLALENLFYIWKDLIEYFLNILVKKYNNYCNLVKENNNIINQTNLISNINKILNKYEIKSSSPILFYLFTPDKFTKKNYPLLYSNKFIKFKTSTKFSSKVNKYIKKLNKYINSNQYSYLGFCPYDIHNRLNSVLNFKIELILNVIESIDKKNVISFDNELLNIKKINSEISKNNKKWKNYNYNLRQYKKIDSKNKKSVIKYVNSFINFYKKSLPILVEKEKEYIKISKDINNITKQLQKNLFKL